MNTLELTKSIVAILDEKKAANIKVIQINEISTLADYFIIATGTSNTHVKSLSDEIEEKLKALGHMPSGVEGYRSNSWILLDYISVVVHIFTEEGRGFYDLDRLWTDGKMVEIELTPDSSIQDKVSKE